MLGVPSNLISTTHCLNYTSHGKTYSSSVLFLRVIAFFLHCAHRKIRRPGGGLCHCKISIFIFALLRICEIAVLFFYTGIAIFTLLSKTEFCSVKIAMLCLCVTASWSSVFFYTGIVKRRFLIVLKSGTTSEDTTSEQNSAHEGTAALQPRHTDARATPHMTPTPKDPDSFADWSDADVLQVLCGTHHFHK